MAVTSFHWVRRRARAEAMLAFATYQVAVFLRPTAAEEGIIPVRSCDHFRHRLHPTTTVGNYVLRNQDPACNRHRNRPRPPIRNEGFRLVVGGELLLVELADVLIALGHWSRNYEFCRRSRYTDLTGSSALACVPDCPRPL